MDSMAASISAWNCSMLSIVFKSAVTSLKYLVLKTWSSVVVELPALSTAVIRIW